MTTRAKPYVGEKHDLHEKRSAAVFVAVLSYFRVNQIIIFEHDQPTRYLSRLSTIDRGWCQYGWADMKFVHEMKSL